VKIEKINNNTLKIILSIEELSTKNITIKDIENGKKKAQNFFFEIIEDSAYADDFLKDNNKLLVEAAIAHDDTFIVTITKLEEIPEIAKDTVPRKYSNQLSPSTLYIFSCITDLNKFIHQVISQNLYVGTNSLYKYNNIYFLIFPQRVVKNINFSSTYLTLTEYCSKHLSKVYNVCKLKENSNIIISNNAIEILVSHILE